MTELADGSPLRARLSAQSSALATCSTLGMPCCGAELCSNPDGGAAAACEVSLICESDGNASQSICVTPCALDSDCGTTDERSCQSGICRPRTVW